MAEVGGEKGAFCRGWSEARFWESECDFVKLKENSPLLMTRTIPNTITRNAITPRKVFKYIFSQLVIE